MRLTSMIVCGLTEDILKSHPIEDKRKFIADAYEYLLFILFDMSEFVDKNSICDFENAFRERIKILDPSDEAHLSLISRYSVATASRIIIHLKCIITDEKLSKSLHKIFLKYEGKE